MIRVAVEGSRPFQPWAFGGKPQVTCNYEGDAVSNVSQPMEDDRTQVAAAISSLWWVPLVRGALLIVIGGYALVRPGMSAELFAQVIGVFVIADGALAILAAILGAVPSRGWTVVRGVVEILAGVFVFAHPALVAGVTAITVMYVVAAAAIVAGVMEIVAAIQDRKRIEGEGWLILSGVLCVLFGLLLIAAPLAFGMLLVRVLGVFAIFSGCSLIAFALRLRKLGKHLAE